MPILAAMACDPGGAKSPCVEGFTAIASGCVPAEAGGDTGLDTGSSTADTGDGPAQDTAAPTVDLPADCTLPASLPADPIRDLGEHNSIPDTPSPSDPLIELVEVVVDLAWELVLGVGQGGLMLYDVSDPMSPALVNSYPEGGGGRYHRLHVFPVDDPGRGLVYLTHRTHGITVVDVSDPSHIERRRLWGRTGLGGMTQQGDLLYITNDDGTLLLLDISDRADFVELGSVDGLTSPWTLVSTSEALYIADGTAGLVVMSLEDPLHPVVVDTVDLGGVQDLALGPGVLYAAAGSTGVVALDLSDPLHPVETDRVDYGTAIQGIAADGEALWAVDQERLLVLDISNPATPRPVGSRVTPQFSMDVAAAGGQAWVGDWGRIGGHVVDLGIAAPDLGLAVSELLINTEGDEVRLQLRNRGQASLRLAGADTDADGFTIQASSDTLAPGETGELIVEWSGGEVDATLCIASDDPDEPLVELTLHTGGGGTVASVGLPAPDFVLSDLDGGSHRLSEHLGHPVVLVYFATW